MKPKTNLSSKILRTLGGALLCISMLTPALAQAEEDTCPPEDFEGVSFEQYEDAAYRAQAVLKYSDALRETFIDIYVNSEGASPQEIESYADEAFASQEWDELDEAVIADYIDALSSMIQGCRWGPAFASGYVGGYLMLLCVDPPEDSGYWQPCP